MKTATLKLMSLVMAAILLASVPAAIAQGNGIGYQYSSGMASLTTEKIGVRVSAYNQVPHFQWWNVTSPGNDYHVMFLKLFEANDTNGDGIFDPEVDRLVGVPFLLPSGNWNFSGFQTVEEDSVVTEVHFNFTTTETYTFTTPTTPTTVPSQTPSSFDVTIQIRVHINTANPEEMKFDLILSGWVWTYDDSILVFQFTITESEHGADQGVVEPSTFAQEGNRFQFGEAYMEFAQQAEAGTTAIPVNGTSGEGTGDEAGTSVYLAFGYFGNETLEYDPILGISSTSDDGTDDGSADGSDDGSDGSIGQILGDNQLLLFAGGIFVVVLVIAVLKVKR